jgi:hypothetical protein
MQATLLNASNFDCQLSSWCFADLALIDFEKSSFKGYSLSLTKSILHSNRQEMKGDESHAKTAFNY